MENPTRRDVIKKGAAAALVGVPAYGVSDKAEAGVVHTEQNIQPVNEPESWEDIDVPEYKDGEFVSVDELRSLEVPVPHPVEILGSDTGLIMSKRFQRFWLFKDGKLLAVGPVGFGRSSTGYDTPEGLMTIYRQEGEGYSSGEFPAADPSEPNMAFATFFNKRGIAFHGSLNFRIFGNDETGKMEYLRINNSHGCANGRKSDAELVRNTLTIGDKVAVLP
jgi:hypothetical protein